jgi:His-Xaa-Ser system radical SAM maturase HxsC
MGKRVMLPLYGIAAASRGFTSGRHWQVVRLRAPDDSPSHSADAAIIRAAGEEASASALGFTAAVVLGADLDVDAGAFRNLLVLPKQFAYLANGDVLGVTGETGRFRTLYRRASAHNSFLITERCNHYCLMCSQPPRDIDDGWLLDEIEAAVELVDTRTPAFTFTGGEPLLEWRKFIRLLERCRDLLPTTAVHVLTNGRAFAQREIASAWASVGHSNLMAGIPIYSAVDHVHDYVVQASGAFDETVLGILRLKNAGQRVEIRVVLHAITAKRIVDTCRWIARNLPFVDHVALMGLENTGFALANDNLIWIDPVDYRDDLASAVSALAGRVPVSIYNLPLCVLPRSIWSFAVQSISDWKNGYSGECANCSERSRCAGFFTSGRPRKSRGISPILVSSGHDA